MQTFFWMILSGSTDLTWPKIGGGQSCFFQLNFKGKTFNSWKSGPTDDFCHLQFYLNGGSEVSNPGKRVGLGTGIPGHLVVTITAIGSFRSMAKLEVFFQKTTGIHGILSELLLVSFVHVVFSYWTYLWDDLFWNWKNPCCLWLDVLDCVTGSASSGLGRMCDPLIVAAENHHFDVVRCLLDAGFDEKVGRKRSTVVGVDSWEVFKGFLPQKPLNATPSGHRHRIPY